MELDPLIHSYSETLLASTGDSGKILVITGGRGAGKTSMCQKIIAKYLQSGLIIRGLLSPGRFVQGGKNGIYALDLSNNETRLLASQIHGEIDGVQLGQWFFDSDTMDWGNRLLENLTKTDILVIDEIGFMEFWLNSGWKSCFEALKQKKYRLALVVIRPECLEAFSSMGFIYVSEKIVNGVITDHQFHGKPAPRSPG